MIVFAADRAHASRAGGRPATRAWRNATVVSSHKRAAVRLAREMAEGTRFPLPAAEDEVTFAGVRHFGNWLRIAADLPDGSELVVLATVHLKA